MDTLAWAKANPDMVRSVAPQPFAAATSAEKTPEELARYQERITERTNALRAQVDAGEVTAQEAYEVAGKIRAYAQSTLYRTPAAFMGPKYAQLSGQLHALTERAAITHRRAQAAIEEGSENEGAPSHP
jgi:hypothetical protein